MRLAPLACAALLTCVPVFASEKPPSNVVGMRSAQKTALKAYPGEIKDKELEKEKGRWLYSFDILGRDGRIHEVWVGALSGKVIGHQIESAGHEAQERGNENP